MGYNQSTNMVYTGFNIANYKDYDLIGKMIRSGNNLLLETLYGDLKNLKGGYRNGR